MQNDTHKIKNKVYVMIICIENNNFKQYEARVIPGTDCRNYVICLFRRVSSNMTIALEHIAYSVII